MWQLMGHLPITRAGCDQTRLNLPLIKMNFTWKPFEFKEKTYLRGQSTGSNFTLIVLPQEIACRDTCDVERLSSYYVCHPHTPHIGKKTKIPGLAKLGLWKINDRWKNTLNTVQTTSEWLQEVTLKN